MGKAGRFDEGTAEKGLLIPKCREFGANLDRAIDKQALVMYETADVSKRRMSKFFTMPENSITNREFADFKVFVQLSLQQLVVGAVEKIKRENRGISEERIIEKIEAGDIAVDGYASAYHDIMHTVMSRLMSKGGRDLKTLRPEYQRRVRDGAGHSPEGASTTLDVMEERMTELFHDHGHEVKDIIAAIKNKNDLNDEQKLDRFVTKVFKTAGEIKKAKTMPKVMAFLRRLFNEWGTNPRVLFEEYSKLTKELL